MKEKIKVSPSSSFKWLNCPGSLLEEKKYKNKNTKYSIEGTIAHKLAEMCIKNNEIPQKYINLKIDGFLINNEMVFNIYKYINYIKKYITKYSKLFVEKKIFFEKKSFQGIGTLDCCIVSENICHIFDLKYGKGIKINSKNNSQLNLYAIGLLNFIQEKNINCDIFKLHIVQPRINNFNNILITKKELIKIKNIYLNKAEIAIKKNAKKIPGEIQCKWCLAKNDCKELNNYLDNIIFKDFQNLDNKDLSDLKKKYILDNYKMILSYVESIKDEIYEKIKKGEKFFNYSIKKGKIYKKWNLELKKNIIEKFGEKIYYKKLLAISEAEKIFKKENLKDFIIEKNFKDVLVKN